MYRLEIHEVRPEAAVLFSVAYSSSIDMLQTYKTYSMSASATGLLQYSDIEEVQATTALLNDVRDLLVLEARHDGDLGTISTLEFFNNQKPFWYKNNVEENVSSAEIIPHPNNSELIMSTTTNNAADNTNAQEALAQALPQLLAQPDVSVMQRVKKAATSPTAKTFGLILGSALAGAIGGLAAVEARNRGYFNKSTPQE